MTKELTTIPKKEISTLQQKVNSLKIENPQDLSASTDLLSQVKTIFNVLKLRKEAITKPLMESLSSARELFRPHEDALKEAETAIKGKQSAYLTAEEARIATEKARVEARVEKGTMRQDTAINKLGAIGEAQKGAVGSVGKISTRTDPHFRIIDETKIPREFLTADLKKIGEVCKRDRAQMKIAGVEYYEEKVIISR